MIRKGVYHRGRAAIDETGGADRRDKIIGAEAVPERQRTAVAEHAADRQGAAARASRAVYVERAGVAGVSRDA